MKKPIIDLVAARMAESLTKRSFINRFIRYWGTVVVDGVEVLDHRRIFWDRWSRFSQGDNTDKLMRHLKAYDSIRQSSYKKVYYAYLYLNPTKGVELGDELLRSNLVKAKNALPDEVEFEVRLFLDNGTKLDLGSYTQTNEQMLATIRSKIGIIKSGYNVEANYDKYISTLARYGLLYAASAKIQSVVRGFVKVTTTETDFGNNSYTVDVLVPAVTIKYKCLKSDFTDGSTTVNSIISDYTSGTGVWADYTKRLVNSVANTNTDTFGFVDYDYHSPALPELWHNSYAFANHPPRTRWYLKASVLRDPGLSLDEKVELITSILDSDAEVEDSSWGVFSIFVVIVAIVLAVPSGGTSLTLTTLAVAVVTFAAIIAIGAMLAQGLGLDSEAQMLGQLSSMIAPIVMVASLVLLGDVVSNGIRGINEGLAQAQLESSLAAAGYSSFEGLSSTMVEQVLESAITKVTSLKMDGIMNTVNQVVGMVNGNKLDELRKSVSSKQDRLKAQQAELEELNNDDGVLMRAIQIGYANQLNQDWSGYNDMETMYNPTRWNTQATKVGALMGMGIHTYYKIPVGKE